MKRIIFSVFMILAMLSEGYTSEKGVTQYSDSVRTFITVVNGSSSKNLVFGLDPLGTDTIDLILGEFEVPPMPPSGVFEARFIGSNLIPPVNIGQGLWRDIRNGNASFTGIRRHEIQFQRNTNVSTVSIYWNFPQGISGKITDLFGGVVVSDTMTGSGAISIQNSAIEKLFMTIYYNNPGTYIESENNVTSSGFRLYQNYPNPFNAYTRINFDIIESGLVTLKLYNMQGRELKKLLSRNYQPGTYSLNQDFSYLAGGAYIVSIQSNKQIKSVKLILTK